MDLADIRKRLRGTPDERARAFDEVRRFALSVRARGRSPRRSESTQMIVDRDAIRTMLALSPTERLRLVVEQVRLIRMPKTLMP